MAKTCPDCKQKTPDVTFYSKRARRCTDCQKSYMANYRANSRLEAIHAYGGPTPKCACPGCDENRLPFLTIDHTNGGGRQHRRDIAPTKGQPPGGGVMFRWLKAHGWPIGYQVLCYNCNVSRRNGPCPVHEVTPVTCAISCVESGHETSD